MKVLNQLLKDLGGDTLKSITLIPDFGCYIKSVKGVPYFSDGEMIIISGESALTLQGQKLCIKEYFEGDIFISGEVRGIKIDKAQ